MKKFYRVRAYEVFIRIEEPDGGMDSVTYANIHEIEAEALPQDTDNTTGSGEFRMTENYFEDYESAKALADSLEPNHPHSVTRSFLK